MHIETVILILLSLSLLYALYTQKVWFIVGNVIVLGCFLFYYFFYKKSQENFAFLFLDDDDYVAADPEIYCGDQPALPDSYDEMGTRHRCLRKGVGAGMMMPDYRRAEFLARPRPPPTGPRLYCGNNAVLPPGYTRFGLKSECLKKGVGIGLAMDPARRAVAQARPLRPPGKRELMQMAERLRITTNDKTRVETMDAIAERMAEMADDF